MPIVPYMYLPVFTSFIQDDEVMAGVFSVLDS